MKGKKYSSDFKQRMIQYYQANKEVDFNKAQEHSKTLGYDTISRNMHNELRREARGPAEAPKECVMYEKTGRIVKNLDSAKVGDRVAIYELVRRGRIQLSIVEGA